MALQTDTTFTISSDPARVAGEQGVFGAGSTLDPALATTAVPREAADPQAGGELMLGGLLLVLFFCYTLLVWRFRAQAAALLAASTVARHLDQLTEEQSVTFRSFVRSATAVGLLGVLTAGLRAALEWRRCDPASLIPESLVPWLAALGAAILLLLRLYKRLVLGAVGLLSADPATVGRVAGFHRILFALSALVFIPWVLLFGLVAPQNPNTLLIISLVLLALLLLHALTQSFLFFISRKISVLQWFLYLCAVEILPISFFVLLALRDFRF